MKVKITMLALLYIPIFLSCGTKKDAFNRYCDMKPVIADSKYTKTMEDSLVVFIELCKQKQLKEAKQWIPSNNFIDNDIRGVESNNTQQSLTNFECTRYNSNELLCIGYYNFAELNYNTTVLDFFLRKSVLKDNKNSIAVLELIKLGILGGEYERAGVLNLSTFGYEGCKLSKEMALYCLSKPIIPFGILDIDEEFLSIPLCEKLVDIEGYKKFTGLLLPKLVEP